MDDKLKSTLDKVVALAKQNEEFGKQLRERLGIASPVNSVLYNDQRFDEIYEYCLEKIIRKQAEDFYSDFPIKSIIPSLVEDYCRMETFRRKDNFGDFCLALYQQIENITNTLCTNPDLEEITSKMWECRAYIKTGENIKPDINIRTGNQTIRQLIFWKKTNEEEENDKPLDYVKKSKSPIQTQYANHKMRIIIYFIGFGTRLRNSDFENFTEITNLLNEIYQCRNMNHRGNSLFPWQEAIINRVIKFKSFSYFKFIGALTQYIDYIKRGIDNIPEILKYAQIAEHYKEITPQLKIVGKMELKDDNKQRFKK